MTQDRRRVDPKDIARVAERSNERFEQDRSEDEVLVDDGRTLAEVERESEVAGDQGSEREGVVDEGGEKRLKNDPNHPGLNVDRDAGVIVRLMRTPDDLPDESAAPIPPPPARD